MIFVTSDLLLVNIDKNMYSRDTEYYISVSKAIFGVNSRPLYSSNTCTTTYIKELLLSN